MTTVTTVTTAPVTTAPVTETLTHVLTIGMDSVSVLPPGYRMERGLTPKTFAHVRVEVRAPSPDGRGLSPGFSVTVSGRDFGGCCHDLALAVFPSLKGLVDLHLSDLDGAPMHAVANAVYWLSGALPSTSHAFRYNPANDRPGKTPAQCEALLREHLRISPTECKTLLGEVEQRVEELHKLRDDILYSTGVLTPLPDSEIRAMVETIVGTFCEGLRPRWKQEADEGIALVRRLLDARPST